MKYVCDVCGWEYDEEVGYPEGGIAPGTKWEDVPEDFECPLCNVGKDQFSEVGFNHIILLTFKMPLHRHFKCTQLPALMCRIQGHSYYRNYHRCGTGA